MKITGAATGRLAREMLKGKLAEDGKLKVWEEMSTLVGKAAN